MNNCKEIQEFFSQYLDQELDEEKSQMVKEHISSCVVCRQELEELAKMSKLLGGLEKKQPPSYFLEMVHSRMESRKSLDKLLKSLFKSPNFKVPVTLSVVALFLFGLLQIMDQSRRSFQGRLRASSDEIGEQYSPGRIYDAGMALSNNQEYEPTAGTKTTLSQEQNRVRTENYVEKGSEPWITTTDQSFVEWKSQGAGGRKSITTTTAETTGIKQSQSVTSQIKPLDADRMPVGAQKQQALTVVVANILIINASESELADIKSQTEKFLTALNEQLVDFFKTHGLKNANLILNIEDGHVTGLVVKNYNGSKYDKEALENIFKKISFSKKITGSIELQLDYLKGQPFHC